MKKIISVLVIGVLLLTSLSITVFAQKEKSENVYVSVAVKGETVVFLEQVKVKDEDFDGKITVNDALSATHKKYYNGSQGYYSYESPYGLSLGKLWGDDSGNFGYFLNNTSCLSLLDEVKEGDFLYAYVYKDSETFSDVYSFFDFNFKSANQGETVTLTLFASGYDSNWQPVTTQVQDAVITVNGEKTLVKTDSSGRAELCLEKAGEYRISAVSDKQVLTPAVCVVNVKGASQSENSQGDIPLTSDLSSSALLALTGAFIVGVWIAFIIKRSSYEK